MNEIIKKAAKEIVRVLVSAFLAWLGISSTGCLAIGDSASVKLTAPASTVK